MIDTCPPARFRRSLTTAVVIGLLPLATHAQSRGFHDESDRLPLAHRYEGGMEYALGGGLAVFDCNGDGLPEILAAGGAGPARLFVNRSEPLGALAFEEGALPVESALGVIGAYALDIDDDGMTDLAVLRRGENAFLRGDGACGFEEATQAWGLENAPEASFGFAAYWALGDSRPTLAIGNGMRLGGDAGPRLECAPAQLYTPDATGFAQSDIFGPSCALSMAFARAPDGKIALRWLDDPAVSGDGNGEDVMVDPLSGDLFATGASAPLGGHALAVVDVTGDGVADLVETGVGAQKILETTLGGFTEVALGQARSRARNAAGQTTGWAPAVGDVDNDGRVDVFVSKGYRDETGDTAKQDPDSLYMQAAQGWEDVSAIAGLDRVANGRGAVLADLNGDWKLDLVVLNRDAPMGLYRNTLRNANHFLGISLSQPAPNRSAVGAMVEVRAGSTQVLQRRIGGGLSGGSDLPLHVGLGPYTQAQLRVTWPDGAITDWQNVNADQWVLLAR
ncbi:FG-GAP repeat protein [Aquimixticola soesokkakensis]|uniref:FG-GAP repeat protein n=1 Tax=Aquimixticola soesokkakensis TaxID=1519096 RepID=A0A1Y5SR81_9RHOB|nr:CRTAC1 family protein [Aquimixticola soesokkakensis]SLN44723.1 FG-GAP repeat protein [Aquimixticola soesokkakensis]